MADESPKPDPAPAPPPAPAAKPEDKPAQVAPEKKSPASAAPDAKPTLAGPPAAKPAKEPPPAPKMADTPETQAFVARFGDGVEQLEDTAPDIPMFLVKDASLVFDVAAFLQKDRSFEHLALITAVDHKDRIEVIYNFWSYSKNVPFAFKVAQGRDAPHVPSLTGLWATADWMEREEYDLMGVVFDGHPDLRRILLPEGWRGHPLRKDYDTKEQYVAIDPESGDDVVYGESREGSW